MSLRFLFSALLMGLLAISSCSNSNKIACPTYADSFPDAKKKTTKPGEQKPQMPPTTKAKSGVLPPGYK